MIRIILTIIAIISLSSCASAPGGNIQKTLMDEGSIKIGMNLETLTNTLGGSGAYFIDWMKINKIYKYAYLTPYTSQYGPDSYNNKYYSFEQIVSGKNSRIDNYKLIKIWDDVIDAHNYYIKILPEDKVKNRFLKSKAWYLRDSNYIAWKNRDKKTQKTAKAHPKKKKPNTDSSKKVQASSGTAFFVDNQGHAITNYHVVEGCNNQSKIVYKGKEINVNLKAKDKYLDLALLKADINNDRYISFSKKPPKKLQRIIVSGYPFGKDLSDDLKFTSGIITSLKGVLDDSTRIQIDAALNPGNSGGPIVYEENGELAAVAVAGLRKDMTEGMNFGIKTASVLNFLDSNKINLSSVKTKFNFSTDDLSELLEDTTVYTFCK